MCAISGVVGRGGPLAVSADERQIIAEKLIKALKHRGPDSDGVWQDERVLLVHTRLAVIDPENGVQPMVYRQGGRQLVLVYNGELYNTAEVREELEKRGYRFRTDSDTEAVLLAFAEWGERCLDRFNGIYAFTVWDSREKALFMARDRMGVKPFFYAFREDGAFCFASEIKGLFAAGVKARLTSEGVRQIMLTGPARESGSGVFDGVWELCPSECGWLYGDGRFEKRKYWDIEDGGEMFGGTFEEAREEVRRLVTDAIKRQTAADVPLCTFLSGGLDSSIISSAAAQQFRESGKKLHTFSVEYRDNMKYFRAGKFQPDADDEYINEMVKYLGSEHHRVVVDTPELVEALYEAAEARDLPGMADVDSSLLIFCREVRKYAAVALSGECADEIFGGYPWYRDPEIRMREGFPWSQSTGYRARMIRREHLEGTDPYEYVMSRYRKTAVRAKCEGLSATEKRMREMMRLNLDWFMQTLLDRKDRMSMHSGLEVRVPFCDHRIAELLYRMPWEYKDHRGREKGLLREAAKGLLPEKVLWRKKSPYPKTHNPSYEKAVRERLREVLSSAGCRVTEIAERSEIEKLISGGERTEWYGQLMNDPQIMAFLIQADHWLRVYRAAV